MKDNDKCCESVFKMMCSCFSGGMTCMTMFVWIYGVAFFVIAIISAIQFFKAETVQKMIMWATMDRI